MGVVVVGATVVVVGVVVVGATVVVVVVVVVVVGAVVVGVELTFTVKANVFETPTAFVDVTVPVNDVAEDCAGKLNVGTALVDVGFSAAGTFQVQLVGLFWLCALRMTVPMVTSL